MSWMASLAKSGSTHVAESALRTLMDLFAERGLHPLVAFNRYFDTNSDHRVDREEFVKGLKKMGHEGASEALFDDLDRDKSGYITLNEIDYMSADLWACFKAWCCTTFSSPEEMEAKLGCLFKQDFDGTVKGIRGIKKLLEGSHKPAGKGRKAVALKMSFNWAQFQEHSVRNGWYGGSEKTLFNAMDGGRGLVTADDLDWFPNEMVRQQIRNTASQRVAKTSGPGKAIQEMRLKVQSHRDIQAFTALLRRKYGNLFRAWRKLLDPEGTMVVTRRKFFTACRELAWSGDINTLWHALDADESGSASLEELASMEARVLGLFKRWMNDKYGNAKTSMRSLNTIKGAKTSKSASLNKDQWIEACSLAGFTGDAGRVFDLMDWECDGKVTMTELQCLDNWPSPAEWLLAKPNERAACNFKDCMHKKYKHFVKAWCVGIDPIGAGKASWDDFKRAALKIHFKEDLPGCWAAMDSDGSGAITLREIDPVAASELARFRCFAHDEFGSVLLAFEALDKDGSGSLTLREFMRGLNGHGFKGDILRLYSSMDFDESGRLSDFEVAFLDEWTLVDLLDEEVLAVDESDGEENYVKRLGAAAAEVSERVAAIMSTKRGRKDLQYPRLPTTPTLAFNGTAGGIRQRLLVGAGRGRPRGRRRAVTPLHEEAGAAYATSTGAAQEAFIIEPLQRRVASRCRRHNSTQLACRPLDGGLLRRRLAAETCWLGRAAGDGRARGGVDGLALHASLAHVTGG
eukprot:CAMPEP_0204191908 /NCGR_PEP_ID=MMETSP0361-20130328/60441_1 /ASSEMBLY_ACC=CAM_ASM_000343 /TAXON_ID=268821 /ORGANISM="Scrippsiella Hangoei, Strain SHTV-5" /LENGTH=742 /DNA_ID=CAMNT_0051152923 /DNA_START=20 /DNA_END=2245 /DNA_ORIENTATION=+